MLWSFEKSERFELAVKFVPSKSKKDEIANDTVVTVYNVTEEDVDIQNYLFLSPPDSHTTYLTKHGSILLADQYSGKIFEQGLFVTKYVAGRGRLLYGINFGCDQVHLGRDRASITPDEATALAIYKIWEESIKKYPNEAALKYLQLLLENEMALDAVDADILVSKAIATTLFDALKTKSPAKSFFCSTDDHNPKVCLHDYLLTSRTAVSSKRS